MAVALRTVAATAVLAVALPLIAGCGEDGSPPVSDQDRSAIERVSEQISQSATAGDPEGFCEVVQPSLVEDAFGGTSGCIRVIGRALRENGGLLSELDIERITVQDEGAIVTYARNPPGDVLFVREDGAWYLALNELALRRQGATGETGSGE